MVAIFPAAPVWEELVQRAATASSGLLPPARWSSDKWGGENIGSSLIPFYRWRNRVRERQYGKQEILLQPGLKI